MIHLVMCSSCEGRGVGDRCGDFAGHGMGGSRVGGGEASFWLPVEWTEGDFGSGLILVVLRCGGKNWELLGYFA